MNQTEINANVRSTLREGETLQWVGRAESFPLMDEANKKGNIIRWCICGLLFLAATIGYIVATASTDSTFNVILELIILIIFAYIAAMPLLDRRKILRRCHYCITDQRMLVVAGDNDKFSLNRKALKIRTVPGTDGCITVLLGAATDAPVKKHRVFTIVPPKSDLENDVIGLIFYNVKDDSELRGLLDI